MVRSQLILSCRKLVSQLLVRSTGQRRWMPTSGTRPWPGILRIVTVTSISGLIGNRGQVNYAAAKAGLHGATKGLALELASRGITVNAVAPGLISTPTTAGLFDADAVARLVPMKRAGTPLEVGSMVAYLVSDAASYVSGQIISVNGAMA